MGMEFNKVAGKFIEEETWLVIGETLLQILIILILTRLFIWFGKSMITKFFYVRSKSPIRISERREATLLRLLKNILAYTINFIALIMILEACNIDVKALLAGVGIVGLAVGFGAQSLVKDIITGFFIILEDQFSVGDFIKVKDFEGEVLEIGLRTTKLKSVTGQMYVIPNGNILEVTNFSILNSVAIIDLTVPNNTELEQIETILADLLTTLPTKYSDIVSEPKILGIQGLNNSEVVLRITVETLPMRHGDIERAIRKEIKSCMDEYSLSFGI